MPLTCRRPTPLIKCSPSTAAHWGGAGGVLHRLASRAARAGGHHSAWVEPLAMAACIKSKGGVLVQATVPATGSATRVADATANGTSGHQVKERVQDCKAQLN